MPKLQFCPLCKGGSVVRWRVDEAQIRASFRDGGMVADNFRGLMRTQFIYAKEGAPYRTGRLKRLHYTHMGPASAAPARSYWIGTKAGYAHFLRGTAGMGAGYILPKRGDELELRPIPYSYFTAGNPGRFRDRVHGQPRHEKADWLKDAAIKAFIIHGLLDFKTGRPIR